MNLLFSSIFCCLLLLSCQNNSSKVSSFSIENNPTNFNQVTKNSIQKSNYFSEKRFQFAWLNNYKLENTLANKIATPAGFERQKNCSTMSEWLRHLPLKENNKTVYLYNGSEKYNQEVHSEIFDLDVGNRDLQQCADAIMRLRSEFLFHQKKHKNIHFKFVSGDNCAWQNWEIGNRPIIKGNNVTWKKSKAKDSSYDNFKKYLQTVFMYAGTASLVKEMQKIAVKDIQPGDVFIQGGSPGHAILVMDVAVNSQKEKVFLLAQSYMPAQDFHLLKNLENENLSPWYNLKATDNLKTPEWTFSFNDLRRF